MNTTRNTAIAVLLALLGGCADSADKSGVNLVNNTAVNNQGGNNTNAGGGTTPEVETEFEFAQPAVLGTDVFVANESLNSVAIIDSRSLGIRTIPVGFRPTRVVGPAAPSDGARVYVLNQGSSTVSIVTPNTGQVKNVDVLRGANALAASADGSWALAWFDQSADEGGSTARDLSGATLVRADGTASALAVGFRIERVTFTPTSALVVTDDGISVVRPDEITGDALVPPVAVLPPALQQFDRTDREVVLDPDGAWAVARVLTSASVVLTELETGLQWVVQLPGVPTDLDWVPGTTPRVLGLIRQNDLAFVSTVPDGLIALSEATPATEDMGADMGPDVGMADMGSADVGSDMGVGGDAGSDMGVDAAAPDLNLPPPEPSMPVAGFWYLPLEQHQLGAAEVAPNGANALIFSTIGEERRAILFDFAALEQRSLSFEKGVRGAVANETGTTYVVLHSKEDGAIPPGASPSDPEFIARSWGLSAVDVNSAATRLVLTDQEPGEVTLWKGAPSERLYMIFAQNGGNADSLRDVLQLDLESFATDTFRVPSPPEGLGRVDDAGRIYVNQLHPQGRITFIEVANGHRQTITGYQLNSGID